VLLDLVCHYFFFLKIFASIFITEIVSPLWMCLWFWDKCYTGFIEWVKDYSFPFYCMKKFKECWYWFLLKGLVEFNGKSIRSWTFLFLRRLFIAASISLHIIDLFRWLISSWFSFQWS
jgi:hypothetical protein